MHRKLSGCADARIRLGWMQRIFTSETRVRVLDWETDTRRPSSTIETLRRMRRLHPEPSPVLLMGEDAFAGISGWVGYPGHLTLCDVAVFSRCGQPQSGPGEWRPLMIAQWRGRVGSGRIIRAEIHLPAVSATLLRGMAFRGESLRGLVPEIIRQDIEGAYGQDRAATGVEI